MLTPQQLETFMRHQPVAFIAPTDQSTPASQRSPLRPCGRHGVSEFYFSINANVLPAAQYQQGPRVSLYFFRKGLFRYESVMLSGRMEILRDPELKRDLWSPKSRLFYRRGSNDPNYCILKFTATEGRYYCDLKTEPIFFS